MAEIARRQHGVVARRQLLAAGVSGAAVARMTASGSLTAVHAGVYRVAAIPSTREAGWIAAVLAGGNGAALSHRSAGELWDMLDPIEGPIHVTVPHGRRTHAGVLLHRSRDRDRHTVRKGIRVTTPSRTLVALAATSSNRRLVQAIDRADHHGLLDIPELARLCEASRGRKGTARLSSLLAHHRSIPQTRSELERRFLRLCRDAGLPRPAVNVPIDGIEVDFVWPSQRLVVELDGYAFHRDDLAPLSLRSGTGRRTCRRRRAGGPHAPLRCG
ncbi:MAG: type IV toxin-antitoxin system AbiEi family antitoxin domain-containing protein [Solirubrobacterales bacterium]